MYYLEPDVTALLSLTSNIVNWPRKLFSPESTIKSKTFVELLTPRNCKQGQLRLFLVAENQ